jgi:SpoVK/Ycf46/Vps4 family AAA+-type ATPase
MSIALERKYKELLADARSIEKEDPVSASKIYLDCATLMYALADTTDDEFLRSEREKLADELKNHADRLKSGEITVTAKESGLGEFHSYIRDNIMRKEKEGLPSWEDIGGLENVKDLIKKSVVIGIIENKPKAIEAWNTILFYGPPGTGKTLMAAVVAKNIDATFFDVKVSQMLSKYYGESPKIMSALFEVAREEAPSVVFIDEFDSIALSRGGEIDEESRRGLSTLLAELDGLQSKSASKKIRIDYSSD